MKICDIFKKCDKLESDVEAHLKDRIGNMDDKDAINLYSAVKESKTKKLTAIGSIITGGTAIIMAWLLHRSDQAFETDGFHSAGADSITNGFVRNLTHKL